MVKFAFTLPDGEQKLNISVKFNTTLLTPLGAISLSLLYMKKKNILKKW